MQNLRYLIYVVLTGKTKGAARCGCNKVTSILGESEETCCSCLVYWRNARFCLAETVVGRRSRAVPITPNDEPIDRN